MSSAHGGPRMSLAAEIDALQSASVPELVGRYGEVFGRPPRSRNAAWLRKRLAFALQERALGGLSRVARARIDELAADVRLPAATTAPAASADRHELRPGQTLVRLWRRQRVHVLV